METVANKSHMELLKQLEESERRLQAMVFQMPAAVTILRGKHCIIEMANTRCLELFDKKEEDVLNKPALDAIPELKTHGIKELLDTVYETGNIFTASELEVNIRRRGNIEKIYVNLSYDPLYDSAGNIDGIMAVAIEVTEQVEAKKKITIYRRI